MEYWFIVLAIFGWLIAEASGHTWVAYAIYSVGVWILSRNKPLSQDDSARDTDVTLK